MKNYASFNIRSRIGATIAGILVSCTLLVNAHAAPTPLATEPITSSNKINALPNVMYLLDDSGSMSADFLPDWAGPYQALVGSVITTITPAHQFFNTAYNGVAYNPGTRYDPPVMYGAAGTPDTTTYPGQTGQSAATGGDASATPALPNWRAVKVDGYGIQSASTVNLEGQAFSYTTVAGEYCDSAQLRNCVVSAVPVGVNIFPAKLRWCTTSALSVDTTANAGTACQASNIADTPTNALNGVTVYTFPRIPRPHTATITVGAAGTVTNITVGGLKITSADATGLSNISLAADIAAKINACTYGITGTCAVVGYSATIDDPVSLPGSITVTAPAPTAATPVVTGVAAGVAAFSNGNVPGSSLLIVITPAINSYPYPGTAIKGAKRFDCAGATCTYAEEMINYANWYAYYRTRMQMMKTDASIAFSNVDDKFRVGYYSINNGAGAQFLNPSAFDGVQKNLWYTKFLSAVPFGATPMRNALASIGQMYAGKVTTLNLQPVADPVQYSCQQNYTILSTDGYWNDATNPKQIDGSTDIGEQDNNLDRPYYDGGTFTRTVSQTTKSESQVGINTLLVESRTRRLQTISSRLSQTVVTTDTYPWTTQTSTLQTQTTPLNKTDYALVQSTYPLTSTTKQLQESTFTLNSTPRILQSYINNLTQTTTPLEARTYKVTVGTQLLTKKDYNVTVGTQLLTQSSYKVTVGTQLLTQKDYKDTVGTQLLTQKDYKLTTTTYALQSSTYKLKSSTRQLQQKNQYSTDGGDTWPSTGWVDVGSCTVHLGQVGWVKNVQCRYDTAVVAHNVDTCTTAAASVAPNYIVAQAVTCAYETVPIVAAAATCNVVAQSGSSPYTPSVSCGYSAAFVQATGQASCAANDQTALPAMSGDKVVCAYDAVPTTTNNLASCTWKVPSPAASTPKTDCSYQAASNVSGQATCSAAALGTITTNNTVWNTGVTCTYDAVPTTTNNLASCTWTVPAPAASAPKTDCSYQAASNATGQATCSAVPLGTVTTNGTAWSTGVMCSYDAVPTTTPNLASCTWKVPATAAAAPKTDCSYQAVSNASGQASCTAAAPATITTDSTVWNTGVACSYDAAPTTLANQATCTWVVPATAASLPRTDCVYNALAATSITVATCTAVARSTGSTDGTVWSGPAVDCAYLPAVLTGTNLLTCTTGTPSVVPPFGAYTTCGYINGVTTTGLNSCAFVADSPGPVYAGPANACAYTGVATVANVANCTVVPKDLVSFSAPQKACAYEAVGTPASGLASCTALAQSAGPTNYVGPNVSCAYSAIPTVTNPGACTVNVEAGPSYASGAKVSCAYASGITTANVAACTVQAKQMSVTNGSAYAPATDCAYGTPSGWANATAACVPAAASVGSPYAGPVRECRYSTPTVDTLTATCAPAAQDNNNLSARVCVPGAFPKTISTVTTTVDSCSTDPTTGVSPVDPAVVRSTATACAYLAPTAAATTATCTPHAADVASPFSTAVTCTNSDTGYVAVAPSCTTVGTLSPLTFDATGTNVECRSTDTTPYTVDYPSGPVPVATCTAGTDPATKVQTTCTPLLSTGPTPVDPATCPASVAPIFPSYVTTTCTPTTATSTVTGCTAPAATAPLWQTVTCTDDGTGTSNTLADVASYYYWTDLRTAALGNCTGSVVPPAAAGNTLCSAADDVLPLVAATPGDPVSAYNNVPITAADPNKRQHMTTFTLGLGASGYMKFSATYLIDASGDYSTVYGVAPHAAINGIAADPANGVCSWQSTGNCNWPFPASDEQTTIDDLWHAGVNGHGAYFSATDPDSLSASISAALNTVAAAGGASAAPALSNPSLTPGDNYLFGTSYTSLDWTGELVRRQLDPYTGAVALTNDWAAQGKLDAKAPATRNIYVFDGSVAVTHLKAFTSANFLADPNFLMPHISTSPTGLTQYLCASPLVCLSAADQLSGSGANLVNFLRGDRTYENTPSAPPPPKYYRLRQHVLGDLVNAQALYVNKPFYNYADPGYDTFVASVASRQAAVFAGANDGMLHAFAAKGTAATETAVAASAAATSAAHLDPSNAALASAAATAAATAAAAVASDATIGQELWSYIPSMVMPNLYKLADMNYKSKHSYYVDATPVVGDICTSNCTDPASAVWKSILVGGLGRGGRGYYALDITDPATPKALWEFTDGNMGYSYGNPLITKVCDDASCATKTWAVLVTSGYNNIPNDDGAAGDGVGRLYVLNAATGALIRTLSTGVGDVANPSGLARISGYVVNPQSDNTVEAVYGGDLNGNLWRFDVDATLGAAGYEAQLLAILKDAGNNLQPITTAPELGEIPSNHVKVVYVGTGRFLAGEDASDTSQQSIYAIKDDRAAGATPATPIFDNPGGDRSGVLSAEGFVRQIHSIGPCPAGSPAYICIAGQNVLLTTANPVDFTLNNGWFVDLINASERANTDPALVPGLLVFNTNAPSLLACDVGGKGYQYWFDYKSGGPLSSTGIIGVKLGDNLYSSPTIISTGGGELKVLSGCSGVDCYDVRQPPGAGEILAPRRTAWREWIRE